MTTQPPVFWTEVFSRSDQRWVPVDPVTGIVRKKAQYDPSSDTGPVRMVYVVAYEEGERQRPMVADSQTDSHAT
jgi:xeroderma pigmentosum group C-complementing protein